MNSTTRSYDDHMVIIEIMIIIGSANDRINLSLKLTRSNLYRYRRFGLFRLLL